MFRLPLINEGEISSLAFGSVCGSIGAPAAIKPRMGTSTAFSPVKFKSLLTSFIERFLPGVLLISFLASSAWRCSWTVARELTPMAWAIWDRVGAEPDDCMYWDRKSRICRCFL